jgi:hypothetical protein
MSDMEFLKLLLLLMIFYGVVFFVSDNYLLPKLDRYLDARNKRTDRD